MERQPGPVQRCRDPPQGHQPPEGPATTADTDTNAITTTADTDTNAITTTASDSGGGANISTTVAGLL
nr:unnamed protein product [Digitaria exilis]